MAKYGYANRIGYVKKSANEIMRKKCKIAVGEKKLKWSLGKSTIKWIKQFVTTNPFCPKKAKLH